MPLRDDLLTPIPGANPSGENLRYAPVYDQIKEARREEADVAQGEWQTAIKKADWPLVVKLAGEALAKKSKDLQLAAWLTEALLRREGFAGLKDGLDLVRSLLENFWDTLYPEIEDDDLEMRATPLEWIGSRLDEGIKRVPLTRSGVNFFRYKECRTVPYESDSGKAEMRAQAISENKLTPEEFDAAFGETPTPFYEQRIEQLEGCIESSDALTSFCDERFGDFAPNFGSLKKSLEEVKTVVHVLLTKRRQAEGGGEAEQPAEQPADYGYQEAARAYDGGAAAAPARAPARAPRKGGPLAPEPVDRDDAIDRVVGAARWLRQNDAYGPAGYLLTRALRFGELRAGGSSPDVTLFEPPPTETRQEIKRLASEGYWQEALDAAEAAAGEACGRAWLDVHRYAVQACEQLGYSAPAEAIKAELRALLADIPTLSESVLMDDTPTANPDTRAWIKDNITVAASAQAAETSWYTPPPAEPEPAGYEAEGTEERPPDAYDLAMQAVRSGDVKQAIEILSAESAQAASGRARFQRKVQLAQVCLGSGHPAIAYPILEDLAEEIDRRKLEDWEAPETIAHALGLLYRSMQNAEVAPEQKHRIYSRICRLDPVQALSLSR